MLIVDETSHGQRLDNFLLSRLKGLPRSHLYRIIRKGKVRVNKKRVKPDYRIQTGDAVRVPSLRLSEPQQKLQLSPKQLSAFAEHILYEDEAVIVINKPVGVPVHGGTEISLGVIDIMRQLKPECRQLELVHRLDKATSGCLMMSKKRSALVWFHGQFQDGAVEKIYSTLLVGAWQGAHSRVVNAPLKKNILQSGERMVKIDSTGKAAISEFYLKQNFPNCCLVEVKLLTGRTHQIRVHAASIQHPVIGDEKYGDRSYNQQVRKRGVKRMMLHAQKLTFQLPHSERFITVEAPMDNSFKHCIQEASAW